jgi:S1-C subfamily serine protease
MIFPSKLIVPGIGLYLGAALLTFDPLRAAEPDSAATNLSAAAPAAADHTNTVENSVVKVFSTVRYPDYYRPWTKQSPTEMSGSGVVIEGKRILSNAHVVEYASQVQVQANQAGDKVSATVEAIAPGIDLAVLKLDDETFFDTHPPLQRASKLPEIKDAVMAYGYPRGGNNLSITKGIVSRIEFASYNYSVAGLRIQIDAAINPGNSGGPAVAGDKMIGLAFSHLKESENIGYIIPCEEIELFLKDIADGHYDGKPAAFDRLQTLENPTLRSYLKLDKTAEGMIVTEPDSADLSYPLKTWDLITHIGDTPIDDQGMVKFGPNLRVDFHYLIQKIAKNDKVTLTIIRHGKEMRVELPVSAKRPSVVPILGGEYPPYFICGPLVFSVPTSEMVQSFLLSKSGVWTEALVGYASPLIRRYGDKPAFEGEELVVVSSPFFPHKLTKGYSSPFAHVVSKINGVSIRNLKHLVEVLRDSKDEFITIEFGGLLNETQVFPRAELMASTDEILTDNGVRSQGSADTLAIWNAKPAKK